MNLDALFARMATFPEAVGALSKGLSPDDARWRPDDTRWSVVEIVAHLGDEETEDFRARVEHTLRDPAQPWPGIDPEGWAVQRRYRDRDLADELARFADARRESITWLRSLDAPNWDRVHNHPTIGPIRAGDVMASWAAHDALHLRQLAKRLYELARRDAPGFDTRYAGDWTA